MDFQKLMGVIAGYGFTSNREFLLMPSGVDGFYHLGEQGKKDLHLIGVTAEQVIEFVKAAS